MKAVSRLAFAVTLAAALGLFASTTQAADSGKSTGAIKGKVLKANGTPAAGAELRLMAKGERAAKHTKQTATTKQDKPTQRPARHSIASATADLNGEFSLSDVPAGNYVLVARLKGAAARQQVSLHAGHPSEVTLSLKERAAGAKGAKADKAAHKQAGAVHKTVTKPTVKPTA